MSFTIIQLIRQNDEKVKHFQRLGYKMKKKIAPYVFSDDKELEFDLQSIATVAYNVVKTISFDYATIENDCFINTHPVIIE